jgi:hypothetical protein
VKLRLSLLSKRRQSVLAVRTFVRASVKKRVVSTLELSSAQIGEPAFAKSRVSADRVDGLTGRLLR